MHLFFLANTKLEVIDHSDVLRKKVDTIFSKFFNLEPEKQERILNAAMKKFAQKGYRNASTNEIVKEANIAKGMLFHYFHNKKDLFLSLYDYSLQILGEEFFRRIDLNERDLLKRWRQLALLKIEIIAKHPAMFSFIMAANFESDNEAKNDLQNKNKDFITSSYAMIYDHIDHSKWREDIDSKKAIDIINWTIEGFALRQQEKAKLPSFSGFNYAEIMAEMDMYLELFRNCFYKQNEGDSSK